MANKRKLTVDKTYLSVDMAETRGFIHRDYIAHCLRWSHVCKRLMENHRYKTSRILDVGCGRELPMARTLYSSRLIPPLYVGVDVGPIEDESIQMVGGSGKFPGHFYPETDFLDPELCFDHLFDMIISFEVMEHVEPDHMLKMLVKIHDNLDPSGEFIVSTPCWNQDDCAANHVNEMRYNCFGACLEIAGFRIIRSYGTFASQSDILSAMSPITRGLFDDLRKYYDSNFLSCVFAPLYPKYSRNALWVCQRRQPGDVYGYFSHGLFSHEPEELSMLGSSSRWRELINNNWLTGFISEQLSKLNPSKPK